MIELNNVSKIYSDEFGFTVKLLNNISFKVTENEICSVVAPAGSGKSSLLKIIAGLEEPSSGEIERVKSIQYIPAKPSSFPWLSVSGNISFETKYIQENEISEICKLVGLEGYENHFPHNKSFGFRFRLALARAIVRKPSLIIIDEPFDQMDEETKEELYILVRQINTSLKISFLFATTNISEAIFLSDKLFLMKKNPGEIFETITLPVINKIDLSAFNSSEFIDARSAVEKLFKKIDSQKLFNMTI